MAQLRGSAATEAQTIADVLELAIRCYDDIDELKRALQELANGYKEQASKSKTHRGYRKGIISKTAEKPRQ